MKQAKQGGGIRGTEMKKKRSSAITNLNSFSELQQGLTGQRSLIGALYMDKPELLTVYRDYYWPVSFAQVQHILEHLRTFRPSGFPVVLDAGSGPGPAAAAFLANGSSELYLVDQSRQALAMAKNLLDKNGTMRTYCADIRALETVGPDLSVWGRCDCIVFGHSLNELWADETDRIEKRTALLQSCAQGLSPEGSLLVIEPALLSTSRDLLSVRNALVSLGWQVIAPCPGRENLLCPALASGPQHTCHDEMAWVIPPKVASLAGSMKLDKEQLKMTWFLMTPPLSKFGENPNLSDEVFRVVSDPMLNKSGRVRRLICGKTGRFPLSAPETALASDRSGFSSLTRGDYIRVDNPEVRENGWGVKSDTRIKVLPGK